MSEFMPRGVPGAKFALGHWNTMSNFGEGQGTFTIPSV